jgi:hypothetical protein
LLDSRAALLRQFYHHLGTSASDGALTEHDSESGEQALRLLQFGLWNAQAHLIDAGKGDRWRTTSSALASWSGADATDGGRYVSLADGGSFTRFLRFAGDEENSALREPDGTPWGKEVTERERFRVRGNYWYTLGDDQLWVARGANPSATLVADYYQRHALLEEATPIDFPVELAPLIPLEAADLALADNWPGVDETQRAEIRNGLKNWRARAGKSRRTRTPPRMRARRTTGTHFWR